MNGIKAERKREREREREKMIEYKYESASDKTTMYVSVVNCYSYECVVFFSRAFCREHIKR